MGVALLAIATEILVEKVPLTSLIVGSLGAVLGIVTAELLGYFVSQMESQRLLSLWRRYDLLVRIFLAWIGFAVAVHKLPEIDQLDRDILAWGRKRGKHIRVVDTSAIIDGRLVDVCEAHFISGTLAVPRFVLTELHALADSPAAEVRAKGRRGLDMLARLQENREVSVRILEQDFPDVSDVDAKVVRLAKELGGGVLTTDFNLNKVAALEGVLVLNVNDLSNALRPVVLPGESMSLFVMKEGKEKEQGIGYLDNGTMVVVEDGKRYIGKRVEVVVSSILQTSAGRMIFTRIKTPS